MDSLQQFREQLNKIDTELISLLSERFKVIQSISLYKKDYDIPIMQPDRVEEVKSRCSQLGATLDLSEDFVTHLYDLIIREACRIEDRIINENKK